MGGYLRFADCPMHNRCIVSGHFFNKWAHPVITACAFRQPTGSRDIGQCANLPPVQAIAQTGPPMISNGTPSPAHTALRRCGLDRRAGFSACCLDMSHAQVADYERQWRVALRRRSKDKGPICFRHPTLVILAAYHHTHVPPVYAV